MSYFQRMCNGVICGDSTDPNTPAYKDGAFWTMLAMAVGGMILSSLFAIPSKMNKFTKRASDLFDKEMFFLPIPEWFMPILYLGMFVTLLLGAYFTLKKINRSDELDDDKKKRAKSYVWLLYSLIIVFKFLWSWCYLGLGEPAIALFFAACLAACVVLLLILAGMKSWGGAMNGAWFLLWPTALYLALVAVPLNFSTVFLSKSKYSSANKSMRKNNSSLFNRLSPI